MSINPKDLRDRYRRRLQLRQQLAEQSLYSTGDLSSGQLLSSAGAVSPVRRMQSAQVNLDGKDRAESRRRQIFLTRSGKIKILYRYDLGSTRYFYVGGHVAKPIFVFSAPATDPISALLENLGPGEGDWVVTVHGGTNPRYARVFYGDPSLGSDWQLNSPYLRQASIRGPNFFSSEPYSDPQGYAASTPFNIVGPNLGVISAAGFWDGDGAQFGTTVAVGHYYGLGISGPTSTRNESGTEQSGILPDLSFDFTGGINTRREYGWSQRDWTRPPSGPGSFGPYGSAAGPCAPPGEIADTVYGTTTLVYGRFRLEYSNEVVVNLQTIKPTAAISSGNINYYAGTVNFAWTYRNPLFRQIGYSATPGSNSSDSGFDSITYEYGCRGFPTSPMGSVYTNLKYFLPVSSSAAGDYTPGAIEAAPGGYPVPPSYSASTSVEVLPGLVLNYSKSASGPTLNNVTGQQSIPVIRKSTNLQGHGFYDISETPPNSAVPQGFFNGPNFSIPVSSYKSYYRGLTGTVEISQTGVLDLFIIQNFTYIETEGLLTQYKVKNTSLAWTQKKLSVEVGEAVIGETTLSGATTIAETLEEPILPLLYPNEATNHLILDARYHPG